MAASRSRSAIVALPKLLLQGDKGKNTLTKVFIEPIKLLGNEEHRLIPLHFARDSRNSLMVVELVKFAHPYGSWMIVPEDLAQPPYLSSNGNITFVTRVDPLFAVLVIADCNGTVGKTRVFQPLDSLCIANNGINLSAVCPAQQVSHLCDTKVVSDQTFYRLSDEKTLSWLLKKHSILSKHSRLNNQHAADIICQYLNHRWNTIFRRALKTSGPDGSPSPQKKESAAELAMSIMMDNAKANNLAESLPQNNMKRKATDSKKKPPSKKKKGTKNEATAKWWASKHGAKNAGTQSNSLKKRSLRSSTTG
ncbi:Ribonuclease H2 subunit B [Gracilariopsis chorda]|uniref:Ribonuclease H2 subunit B n=1 Tax=Gracilariopsis chorda TaxID=448386 RepID=A0A2V3J1S2_9FLOR|nr:Ribonuclease H2 subunit B [Gracilariopsis chorda]|eukprot:PXF48273.1 Ribonuclease H2 subunit B [Gracilariopsis chorda]